jgi:mersacidin/lichenicidin family type 2 lantibiotic
MAHESAHLRKDYTMHNIDIIRAWKNEDYRLELSPAELAALPSNPAGIVELSDDQMGRVVGGLVAAITYGGICDTYSEKCPTLTKPCDTSTIKGPNDLTIPGPRRW